MANWQQWPVIDGAYKDDARPWSQQDTVNWLPAPAEQAGTRSPIMLRTPPGLIEFCNLGTGAPIRGAHDVEGLLLVVSDTTLFRVSATGVATAIGTIPGVGRVSMDHTPRGAGFHVGIANGQSGYIYDTAAGTLTQITDTGFPGASIFQFVDGYLAFLEPFGKFWGHSELNDGLNYNTLDRYPAESAPDGIVSLIVSHREVFTPGARSGEFFRNTGAATGTFARADGYEMERGAASAYAIARLDNTVYWLGEDGIVYRLEGHQPVRVSNGPLEQALSRSNLTNAFAFTWEDRGHTVFYLTVPDGQTWGYDAWTQRWHRRQSYGLNRWRLATLTKWNGQWIGGDYTNGKLYTLSWADDAVHENGAPLVSERTFPVAHDFGNDLIVNGIRLLFDTGRAGGTSMPQINGDVLDGVVSTPATGTYTVSGGFSPYGSVTVLTGTFPPGLTLNPDGSYSGTYTTVGSYSWTVGGQDALGQAFSTPDTAVVTDPMAWYLVVNTGTPSAYTGLFSGDTWTATNNPAIATKVYIEDGVYHLLNDGSVQYAYSTDQGASWLVPSGGLSYDVSGGLPAFLGGSLFVSRGALGVFSRVLPAGNWNNVATAPSTNLLCVHGGRLVSLYTGRSQASVSTDLGATWVTQSGVFHSAGQHNGTPRAASNGARIVGMYSDAGDDQVHIKYSDDGGATWSVSVYAFPGSDAAKTPISVHWTGSGWAAINSAGQVAYSANGIAWSLSASTLTGVRQADVALTRIMAACLGGLLFSSDDSGATWQTRIDPAGTTGIVGVAGVIA